MYIYIYKKLIDVLHNGDWISKIQVTSCQLQGSDIRVQIQNIKLYKLKRSLISFTLC